MGLKQTVFVMHVAAAILAALGASEPWTRHEAPKESWMRHQALNCYSGHGATDLDGAHGCGTMSLALCKAKCDTIASCAGITVTAGAGDVVCYRHSHIAVSRCVSGQTGYDTWVRTSAPPPPEPAPIPGL